MLIIRIIWQMVFQYQYFCFKRIDPVFYLQNQFTQEILSQTINQMQRPKSNKKHHYPTSPDNINQLSHVSTKTSFLNPQMNYSPYHQQQLLLHTLSQKITNLRQNVSKFSGLKQYHHKLVQDYGACYDQHCVFQKDMETLQLNTKNAIKSLIKDCEKAYEQMAVINDSQLMVESERNSLKDRCQLLLERVLALEENQRTLTDKGNKMKDDSTPIHQNIKEENRKKCQAYDNIQSLRKQLENFNNKCNIQESNNNFAVKEETNKKYQLEKANIKHQQVLERLHRLSENIDDNDALINRKMTRNSGVQQDNEELMKQVESLNKAIQSKENSTRLEQQKFLMLRQDETEMSFELKELEQALQQQRFGYKEDIQTHLRELQRKQQNVSTLQKLGEHLKNLIWTNCRLQEQLNDNVIGDFSMIRILGRTKGNRQERAYQQWIKQGQKGNIMQVNQKESQIMKRGSRSIERPNQEPSVLRQRPITNLDSEKYNEFARTQWIKQRSIYDHIKTHNSSSSNWNNKKKQQSEIEGNQQNHHSAAGFKQSTFYSTGV